MYQWLCDLFACRQVTRQTQFRLEGGSEEVVTGRLEVWREYPGPVAAVDHLRGYLVVGVGHRLELHYRQVGEPAA